MVVACSGRLEFEWVMEKMKEDFCFAPLEGNYYEPDPAGAAACEEKYRKFLRLRRGLKYIETGGEA